MSSTFLVELHYFGNRSNLCLYSNCQVAAHVIDDPRYLRIYSLGGGTVDLVAESATDRVG